MTKSTRQRLFAFLIILGACILLTRTVLMVTGGALNVLIPWVSFLLVLEMLIDIIVIFTAVPWFISRNPAKDTIPLRFGAAAAILHAFRVLIFAMGRVEPWLNFDVKPEQRSLHDARWEWWQVYFASALSIAGVLAVLIIWRIRRKNLIKTDK